MQLIIKSRKYKKDITFSRPGSGYLYVDLNGKEGTLGNQICDGGYLLGECLSYRGDDPQAFERICRNWWRGFLSLNNWWVSV